MFKINKPFVIGIGSLLLILAIPYLVIFINHMIHPEPQRARFVSLVSVRELDANQRLESICEKVHDNAVEILLNHPDAAEDQDRLFHEVTNEEARTLWLADYSCWPQSPKIAY